MTTLEEKRAWYFKATDPKLVFAKDAGEDPWFRCGQVFTADNFYVAMAESFPFFSKLANALSSVLGPDLRCFKL